MFRTNGCLEPNWEQGKGEKPKNSEERTKKKAAKKESCQSWNFLLFVHMQRKVIMVLNTIITHLMVTC